MRNYPKRSPEVLRMLIFCIGTEESFIPGIANPSAYVRSASVPASVRRQKASELKSILNF